MRNIENEKFKKNKKSRQKNIFIVYFIVNERKGMMG